jgi:polysaccharide export outer membrane protein
MHVKTSLWLRAVMIGPSFWAVFMLTSCANIRQLTYIQGAFDTAALSKIPGVDPLIQKGDILSIIVYSDNPEATRIYNQALITTASPGAASLSGGASASGGGLSGGSPTTGGYLVDENGNIEFQSLGLIHIDGITRSQLRDTLNARLKPFLVNPYFTIRFQNYRFTMLGEIGKPGIYPFPSDRINLFEALGLAGDMTFYGRRDNVLVIRETNGVRTYARLDLTKPEIMASPYFYIQQNDVVIFEANKKKVAANDQTTLRNITIATSVISLFAILYTIFHK